MSATRNAASGVERLVTRSLAIVAVAIGIGAAHSWMHGPIEPEPLEVATTQPPDGVDPIDDGTETPEAPTNPTQDPQLPDGHISLADAYAHFENATADFLDVRPAEEYEAGHIAGAHNLSLTMLEDAQRVSSVLQWLDPSRPIVVYCRGGLCSEAKDIGRTLGGAGYTNILILDVGFPGWQDAGYMVETGPGF